MAIFKKCSFLSVLNSILIISGLMFIPLSYADTNLEGFSGSREHFVEGSFVEGSLAADYFSNGVLEHSFAHAPNLLNDHVQTTAYDPSTNTYWTASGGGALSRIHQYQPDGTIITDSTVPLDARSICYRPEDGNMYIASYGGDVYQLALPFDGTVTLIHSGILQNVHCSIAFANGGNIFDVYNGTVREYDFATGSVLRTFSLYPNYPYGLISPYNSKIASDGNDLYFLSAVDDVYVYDNNGIYQTIVSLAHPTLDSFEAPLSLAYTNERIYLHDNSDHLIYGYKIKAEEGSVIPTYDPKTGLLHIPVVDVGTKGCYTVDMKRAGGSSYFKMLNVDPVPCR